MKRVFDKALRREPKPKAKLMSDKQILEWCAHGGGSTPKGYVPITQWDFDQAVARELLRLAERAHGTSIEKHGYMRHGYTPTAQGPPPTEPPLKPSDARQAKP